ncbi:MAG: hypothetical protein A4E28_00096 [Methanocella sp. PtaU1.Bin125]|nr:MAG: hypothetical protein A4E28_00096 [Methanocella sp. PtaU1.Bin125]
MQPGEKYWRFQKFDRMKYSEVNDALKARSSSRSTAAC